MDRFALGVTYAFGNGPLRVSRSELVALFCEIFVDFVSFASKVDLGGNEFRASSCDFVDRSFCPEN